ncbi:MAG: NADH-quinone oxidoreductase subunit H [Deltaproteobacteria bacterium]|nr:NADH-quinone oxidoreductase subunit H [Deltaproteobacteria bacterium]MBW2444563.1 NADH-quinone oxidoreductase subunit H [Deltaproteobacteria bacterium]
MAETIGKILFVLLVVMGAFLPMITWVERKQSAVMQDRIGANRANIAGITVLGVLHPLADVLKLFGKEDFVPAGANRVMHLLAPVIALVPAIITLAVVPFAGVYDFGGENPFSFVIADVDWGLLYVFAVGSIAAYGTIIAGWASNNNWALLGTVRASAQMISYEVTMGLSVVGVFMCFQTLSLQEMSLAQDSSFRLLGFLEHFGLFETLPGWLAWIQVPTWGIFLQPMGFVMFLTCIMAENKRPPFDLPEAESELIAGYHLEYSGMRWGLFYTAEFLEVPVIGCIVTALFLGGWSIPFLDTQTLIGGIGSFFGEGFATGVVLVLHVHAFLAKVVIMIWLQMLIRWSLPRFRYDQVMDLCWKIMLPLSLVNIFVTAVVLLWFQEVVG